MSIVKMNNEVQRLTSVIESSKLSINNVDSLNAQLKKIGRFVQIDKKASTELKFVSIGWFARIREWVLHLSIFNRTSTNVFTNKVCKEFLAGRVVKMENVSVKTTDLSKKVQDVSANLTPKKDLAVTTTLPHTDAKPVNNEGTNTNEDTPPEVVKQRNVAHATSTTAPMQTEIEEFSAAVQPIENQIIEIETLIEKRRETANQKERVRLTALIMKKMDVLSSNIENFEVMKDLEKAERYEQFCKENFELRLSVLTEFMDKQSVILELEQIYQEMVEKKQFSVKFQTITGEEDVFELAEYFIAKNVEMATVVALFEKEQDTKKKELYEIDITEMHENFAKDFLVISEKYKANAEKVATCEDLNFHVHHEIMGILFECIGQNHNLIHENAERAAVTNAEVIPVASASLQKLNSQLDELSTNLTTGLKILNNPQIASTIPEEKKQKAIQTLQSTFKKIQIEYQKEIEDARGREPSSELKQLIIKTIALVNLARTGGIEIEFSIIPLNTK